jgi:hypothetical protein
MVYLLKSHTLKAQTDALRLQMRKHGNPAPSLHFRYGCGVSGSTRSASGVSRTTKTFIIGAAFNFCSLLLGLAASFVCCSTHGMPHIFLGVSRAVSG